jgi:hypothetical protein
VSVVSGVVSVVVGGSTVVVGASVVVSRSVVVARVVVCGRVVVGRVVDVVTDAEEFGTVVGGLVVDRCVVRVVAGRVDAVEVVAGSVAVGASAGGRVTS